MFGDGMPMSHKAEGRPQGSAMIPQENRAGQKVVQMTRILCAIAILVLLQSCGPWIKIF